MSRLALSPQRIVYAFFPLNIFKGLLDHWVWVALVRPFNIHPRVADIGVWGDLGLRLPSGLGEYNIL